MKMQVSCAPPLPPPLERLPVAEAGYWVVGDGGGGPRRLRRTELVGNSPVEWGFASIELILLVPIGDNQPVFS